MFLLGFFSGVNSLLVSGKTVKPINPLNLWMFRLVTTQTLTSMQLIRPSFFSRHKSLSLLMMRWRNTAAGADGGPTPVSRGVSSQSVFWLEKTKTRNLQFHHQMMFAKKKTPLFWLLTQKRNGINRRTMQNWPAILSP